MYKYLEKTPCRVHAGEYVTNFCKRSECLRQLCPNCLCQHSERHQLARTLPDYEPIEQTYKTCSVLIETQKCEVQKAKRVVKKYHEEWCAKKSSISQALQTAENDVMQAVRKTFEQIRKTYRKRILQEQQKLSFLSGDKFNSIANAYEREVHRLQLSESEFKARHGSNFIRSLYLQVIPECEKVVQNMETDFNKLLESDVNLQYKKDKLIHSIKSEIIRDIALEITYYDSKENMIQQLVHNRPLRQENHMVYTPLKASQVVNSRPVSAVPQPNTIYKTYPVPFVNECRVSTSNWGHV